MPECYLPSNFRRPSLIINHYLIQTVSHHTCVNSRTFRFRRHGNSLLRKVTATNGKQLFAITLNNVREL